MPTQDEWASCDWIESKGNRDGEQRIMAYVTSPSQCIALVKEHYPDATIASVQDSGAGACWAQYPEYGSSKLVPDGSGYKSCVL